MKLPGGDIFLFRGVMLKRSTHELLSQNTVKSDARRQLLEMAPEDQGDASPQTTASDEDKGTVNQVTAGRYWKKVYDELGGSPGSTSAATCTRRHYERLVLPFERHIKGEEDKPLPPSKPRKPYKRNLDGKMSKAEVKRKRTQSDRELDSERSPEAACQGDAGMHPHSSLWASTSDRHHAERPQPSRAPADLCSSVFAHLLPIPTAPSWTAHVPSAAGEVISPLEKKKRMAQASLNLPMSPQGEDKERPSVIHCPQSPARASSGQNCNSSDGSPLPLSSSSSRSPSSSSILSEDSSTENEDKPTSASEPPHNCSSTAKTTSSCSEDSKSASCSQISKDPAGGDKDASHIGSQSLAADSKKSQLKDHAWKPNHKAGNKYLPHPVHLPPSFTDWAPTSTSSFTKVIPKSMQLLRPAPVRPAYKTYPGRAVQQDDSLPCAKEMNSVVSLFYPTEKRDKSRTMLQKVALAQQSPAHATSTAVPMPCVLSSYDKPGRDSRHHPPLHSAYLPARMRLPPSQLMYRHVPVAPAHPAVIGPAVYPYPYPIPMLSPQTAYACALPAIYSHKL
ncbi:AT-rich interactive domain-containing protein 5A isoform X2 [Betta splendens]|uniref:AT-rich interactive domain-containing protein 5A isoform X2 n=1 Tax=Betta splendens TaxID=158456 RepID=A0A6P7NEX4_BETSP|nr:AT-rich interactive domain-containing protein 5A isoform X2 [Betta splendens]